MTLTIDGFDVTPYIAFGGLKWQRADVDGPNAGRQQNGDVIRDRVAIKIRWDVSCRPLKSDELSKILSAVQPEYVTVQYLDPVTNTVLTGQFYSNNIPASFLMKKSNGTEYWGGVTFPLIQK